jgi:DNA-binding beta-propeller fold protein YncE
MAATPDGHLYVMSGPSGVPYITEFDATGNVVTQWGTDGHGPGQFFGPTGLGLDASGDLYVADSNNYRVQVFGPTGNYLGQWGSHGSGNGQFGWPADVAVVGSSIYVLDAQRIEQFTLTPVAATPTSWGKVKATYR